MPLGSPTDVAPERRFTLMAKGVRYARELNGVCLNQVLLAPVLSEDMGLRGEQVSMGPASGVNREREL
jgi:hypothetical protein